MYDQIGLKVEDVAASVRFDEPALAPESYAPFLLDSDGNKLDAVCLRPEE